MLSKFIAGAIAVLVVAECAATDAEAIETRTSREVGTVNGTDYRSMPVSASSENAGDQPVLGFRRAGEFNASLLLSNGGLPGSSAMAVIDPQGAPTPGTTQKPASRTKHVIKLVVLTLVVFVGITFAVVLLDRKD